jgi:hypothetical protein
VKSVSKSHPSLGSIESHSTQLCTINLKKIPHNLLHDAHQNKQAYFDLLVSINNLDYLFLFVSTNY